MSAALPERVMWTGRISVHAHVLGKYISESIKHTPCKTCIMPLIFEVLSLCLLVVFAFARALCFALAPIVISVEAPGVDLNISD